MYMDKFNVKNLEELMEEVIMQYTQSYDLDIAMLKADVSMLDQKIMLSSESFMFRVKFQDAIIKEKIMKPMLRNLDSVNPSVSQKAAIDLGNIIYKERFGKQEEEAKSLVPDSIVMVGK